jgi:hypothetical protein
MTSERQSLTGPRPEYLQTRPETLTMRLDIHPSSPCPCRSGKQTAACCLSGGRLVPPRVVTTRPTGAYAHPRCYSRPIAGCSQKISLEHFVSRTVLECLEPKVGGLTVTGMGATPFQTSAGKLGAKILRSSHNSALEALDRVGTAFFAELSSAPEHLARSKGTRVLLLNGHDLERWLLKAMIGSIAGHLDTPPETRWIDLLFGTAEFGPGEGLFLDVVNRADTSNTKRQIALETVEDKQGVCHGLVAHMEQLRFGLATKPGMFNGTHRPQCLRVFHGVHEVIVLLGWDSPEFNLTVSVLWTPTPSD